MLDVLEKIIWCYEVEYSITLSEMYAKFDNLFFDFPVNDSAEKVLEKLPLKYKSNYQKYLVNTFDNNAPLDQFVYIGSSMRSTPKSEQEMNKENLKRIKQVENIRRFLSIRREK